MAEIESGEVLKAAVFLRKEVRQRLLYRRTPFALSFSTSPLPPSWCVISLSSFVLLAFFTPSAPTRFPWVALVRKTLACVYVCLRRGCARSACRLRLFSTCVRFSLWRSVRGSCACTSFLFYLLRFVFFFVSLSRSTFFFVYWPVEDAAGVRMQRCRLHGREQLLPPFSPPLLPTKNK